MKKLSAGTVVLLSYLASATAAFAAIGVQVVPPNQGIAPTTNPGTIVSSALRIVFVAAAILVLFFLVVGAFRWITSGGEKEAIQKARGTIINALIGLAILALAFFIVNLVGSILNINVTGTFLIPNLMGT